MPISALVVTLSSSPELQQRALDAIANDRRLTPGELQGTRLPVVVETETTRESTHLVREELPAIEGVVFVDVVMVDFSDAHPPAQQEPS